MHRSLFLALIGLVVLAGPASAFNAVGTLQKVDVEKGIIYLNANGQDRMVRAARDIKVYGADGKELPEGLKARGLVAGLEITVTVEREDNTPVIKVIRFGKQVADPKPKPVEGGKPSFGLKPLDEMTAEDRYKGEDGGLYGGGKNEPPATHLAAAKAESAKIVPLDADGKPANSGKIVMVSISMSNATQEFSVFKRLADADPAKSPLLTIVDCAQGGQAMAQWVNPQAKAWQEADRRLAAAQVSPKQVQVAWIKLANIAPSGDLQEHGRKLYKDTLAVILNAKAKFPNLRLVYLASRIYGGWSTGRLNPEPYAYEGAFAVRWLIQDQIKGDAALNYDPAKGEVKAPLLLWGAYLWADGTTPRKSDGLVWNREDMAGDGVHPTNSGREKVAKLLLNFFKSNETARGWFTKK